MKKIKNNQRFAIKVFERKRERNVLKSNEIDIHIIQYAHKRGRQIHLIVITVVDHVNI